MTDVVTGADKALQNVGADKSNLDPSSQGKAPAAPASGEESPEATAKRVEAEAAAALAAKGKEAAGDPPKDAGEAKPDQAKDAADKAAKDEPEALITKWAKFDDPSADAAVDLLKSNGVSPAEAHKIFGEYVKSGKAEDIDVKALEAKIGKSTAHLVLTGINDYATRQATKHSATEQLVHEIAGSKDNWDVVAEWARTRAENDTSFAKELLEIRDDISKGGRAAKSAAKDLLEMYNGNPNTHGLGNKNIVKGDKKPDTVSAPLSRAEYVAEYEKLHANGNPSATSLAALDRRRSAGMKAGL